MTPYRRLIGFVRPHLPDLSIAYFSMFMNSLLSALPAAGLTIPFVDTILAGKPIVLPHQERIPDFVLAWVYRQRGYWGSVAAHATVNTIASIALVASS